MAKMRIDTLRSAVEAAGVTMAPASDQFDDDPAETAEANAVGYVRSWTSHRSADAASAKLKNWFTVRWPRTLSAG